MKVSNEVINILDRCSMNATVLTLPEQLDRADYMAVNKVLEAAGGKWSKRAKAHIFEGEAADAIEPIILTGTVVHAKSEFGFFETPLDLAAKMISRIEITSVHTALEPSAGRGAIASHMAAVCPVDCIEVQQTNCDLLRKAGIYRGVLMADFLQVKPQQIYHRVLMNPPFAKQADVRHVLHAAEFVRPGGRLAAIMSAGVLFRQGALMEKFRLHLRLQLSVTIKPLPEGSFKASGTNVNTVMLTYTRKS